MGEKEPKTRKPGKDSAVSEDKTKVSKPKKEKRKREHAVEDAEESPQLAVEEPQKKKHKKNRTGFPDPEDDPSLSEQASKGRYLFLTRDERSKWKFSKPRQNWLIRNIWSDKIPDTHLALTIQYLSNVKGGVRETLIKDCRSILSESAPQKVASAEVASQPQPAVVEPDQLKHVRARALLDALEKTEAEPPNS
ncbi:hypothetical protein MVEN_01272100 [Mycena venus]|uniref:WKF domain-containing protein n=1 Tax=Mycena venus TaxID=2733690 RepID=A0A8H6Y729_9AGAR|nr:hypothetical protein MVEN_01272100 [Mycena venus]